VQISHVLYATKCLNKPSAYCWAACVCGKAMEYLTNLKMDRSGKRVDTEVLDEESGLSDSVRLA